MNQFGLVIKHRYLQFSNFCFRKKKKNMLFSFSVFQKKDPGGLNERLPYWLNGMTTLAYFSKNQTLISKVESYMDYIIENQLSDGKAYITNLKFQ